MKTRLIQALDRVVMDAACRSLEREIPPAGPAAPAPELRHPDYFADLGETHLALRFDGHGGFSFPSPIQTGTMANDTVVGRIFSARPRRHESGRPPLAILLHGWNGEMGYRYHLPWLARRLAHLGVDVMMPELPYHGARKPHQGPSRNFLSSDLHHTMTAARQAIADVRALIRWAHRRGHASIGLWGFSLGAWLSGLVGCVEPDLRGLVLMTPVTDIDRAFRELPFCRHTYASMQAHGLTTTGLGLDEHRPKLSPQRILLIASRHDQFAPAETVEHLWRAWQRPEIWRVNHGHISVLLSLPINLRAVRWLQHRLVEAPSG